MVPVWLALLLMPGSSWSERWWSVGAVQCLVFILVVLMNLVYVSRVSEDGLRTYNGYGINVTIPWPELEYVGVLNILGLRYLRFRRPGLFWATIVPFDVVQPAEFVDACAAYVGKDHPMIGSMRTALGIAAPV
jgi:hypothetical protein